MGSCGNQCKSTQTSPGAQFGPLWNLSVPLSISGWGFTGVFLLWRRETVKTWKNAGLNKEIYDLMNRMRGGQSRLSLLRSMAEPRHRQELSELTGIDWKEVDREVSVLEKHGLIKMTAQSGSVRMYQITEQGRLLMKLIDDLQPDRKW